MSTRYEYGIFNYKINFLQLINNITHANKLYNMPTIYIIKFKKHNNMSQIKDLQLTINDATHRYNSPY